MTKLFVLPLFYLFLFNMFIGISKAEEHSLFEDPKKLKKFCNYCKELAKSSDFTDMITELQGNIPIESSYLDLDENVNAKYSSILTALSSFVHEMKEHKTEYGRFIVPDHGTDERDVYDTADKFINVEHVGLKKKIGKKRIFSKRSKADAILDKAVQCANKVVPSPSEQKNGNHEKLTAKCIDSDGYRTFKTELPKILKLIEPSDLYKDCHALPKSDRFDKMIGIMQNGNIPNDAKEDAALGPNQTYILVAMETFLYDFIGKRGIVDKDEEKGNSKSQLNQTNRFKGIYVPFAYTREVFKNILAKECGIKKTRVTNDGKVTVEYVLKEGLECAIRVHHFRQQILAVKNGGGNEEFSDEEKWAKLDEEFWAKLQLI